LIAIVLGSVVVGAGALYLYQTRLTHSVPLTPSARPELVPPYVRRDRQREQYEAHMRRPEIQDAIMRAKRETAYQKVDLGPYQERRASEYEEPSRWGSGNYAR
jgi:hypothetical protein